MDKWHDEIQKLAKTGDGIKLCPVCHKKSLKIDKGKVHCLKCGFEEIFPEMR